MSASPEDGTRGRGHERDSGPLDVGSELVEWVDERDRVIEVVTRARMRRENLRHRSVGIAVLSSDGRLLVHRRADTKDLRPGWWDVMAGGVVAAGESRTIAAERELAEELGIEGAVLDALGVARHDDVDSQEICHLYRTVHDGPYRFADGEVAEARLVTADELSALRATEPFLPGSIAMLARHLDDWFEDERVRWDSVHRVEFTIEPFVEGNPGPHVTAAIEAARELGVRVEVGPFGSNCTVAADRSPDVVAAIVRTAFEHGATHVNVDVDRGDDR